MADYTSLKVPDLKKILSERGLTQSGNKADLIARLTESDKSKGAGEDEIDWDEDDTKVEPAATTATAPAPTAGTGPVDTPIAVPNQKVDIDPSKTTDLKVTGGENAPVAADGAIAASGSTIAPVEPEVAAAAEPTVESAPEVPKTDFSIGLEKSELEIEMEKRAKRAEKFKRNDLSEEDKKKAEEKAKAEARALKFGKPVVNLDALDGALPEGRLKRGREEKETKVASRPAKRPTPNPPNRRNEQQQPKKNSNKPQQKQEKKPQGKITDDPVEAAKAAARKARFAQAPAAKA